MTSHSVADARTLIKQGARVPEMSACYLGHAAVYSHGSLEYVVIAPTEEALQAAWERQPMAPELDHGEVQRVAIFSVADIEAIGSGDGEIAPGNTQEVPDVQVAPGATLDAGTEDDVPEGEDDIDWSQRGLPIHETGDEG